MKILMGILLLMQWGSPCAAQTKKCKFQFSENKMGTTFKLVFYTSSREIAQQAAQAAFHRIDELEMIFSDYQEQSEVNRLAATGGSGNKIKVSPELWELLVLSRRISKASGGAFDVTIGPLSKLWRRAFRQQEFPQKEKIAEARSLVNFRWLRLYGGSGRVKLLKKGMQLDFGGIAKGYAIDEAFRVLQDFGISQAMVEGGGDLYVGDQGEYQWKIALMDQAANVQLTNQALAASGDTYQYLLWQGKKYSHIIDPRSGYGITGSRVVYVVAKNCALADALASASSLLSGKKTAKLLSKFDACLLK